MDRFDDFNRQDGSGPAVAPEGLLKSLSAAMPSTMSTRMASVGVHHMQQTGRLALARAFSCLDDVPSPAHTG